MSHSNLKSFLLLAYLVFLLSLGRPLHHAQSLGFHSCASHSLGENAASACCCHAHGGGQTSKGISFSNHPASEDADGCFLCDFFKNYHLVQFDFQVASPQELVTSISCESLPLLNISVVPPAARGPPVA